MTFYVEIGALVVSLFILYILYRFIKDPLHLLANSIFGVVVLFLLNLFFGLGLPINFWTIAITALSGFAGIVLILLLHFLKLAF